MLCLFLFSSKQCIIKQFLDWVFVSKIITVLVSVISLGLWLNWEQLPGPWLFRISQKPHPIITYNIRPYNLLLILPVLMLLLLLLIRISSVYTNISVNYKYVHCKCKVAKEIDSLFWVVSWRKTFSEPLFLFNTSNKNFLLSRFEETNQTSWWRQCW